MAVNEALKRALARAGWEYQALADRVGVDPKTVERWVSGRQPHPRIALAAAEALKEDVVVLWPRLRRQRVPRAVHPELVGAYARRSDAPVDLWWDLFTAATQRIDILVYAAVFLHEQHSGLNDLLRHKAAAGCLIRIALGDPHSDNVHARGAEEQFGHGIESRCHLALMHYSPLLDVDGIHIRQHATTLYNSLYRADDDLLVNAHVWGINAYGAPLYHLRRRSDNHGMFQPYADSFERVWATAIPVDRSLVG